MTASPTPSSFVQELAGLLETNGPTPDNLLALLDRVLAHFDCTTGTIHRTDPASGLLQLQAQRGIPAAILDRVRTIPVGKGMAGIAAERRQPVQVCNLQTDASGVVRPEARETRMEGSIAVPVLRPDKVLGVLGVAKPVAYEFSADETAELEEIARLLARAFQA